MALERLGPYRIQRQLGQGGMGTVYAAVNEQTGEPAAVKVLSTLLGGQESFRARFESEIETLKRLKHPTIVQLVGFGEQEGHLFYAMELIDGTSLNDELRKGRRFTWQEVIRFGIAICAALKLAHDSGVIHRDLKPANLMLTRDGQIKLMDFGIARLFGATQLTADGGVVGTVDYMAPEQAEAQPVTARSDLYSLGAVMFALLTGRPPFVGKSLPQIVHALRFDTPIPVQRLAADTPDELSLVIEQLLEKDPKKRIPTALILGNRLKAIEHGLARQAAPQDAELPRTQADDEYRLADDSGPAGSVPQGKTRTIQGKDLLTRSERVEQWPQTVDAATIASSPESPAAIPSVTGNDVTQVVSQLPSAMVRSGMPGIDTRSRQTIGDEPSASAAPPSHFTTIDEDERRRVRRQREEIAETKRLAWLNTGLIVLAVALFTVGLWWFTRPPSANTLHARLALVAAESDLDRLEAAESDLDAFLQHYPLDPRADEVRQWKEQVESHRETRRFARRTRWSETFDDLTTCERLYAEAAQLAATDPETALLRMQSLVALFGDMEEPDEPTRRTMDLARQQVPRLEALVKRAQAADREVFRARLGWADAQSDRDVARPVYASIVTLLADKPWAEDLVARARQGLSEKAPSAP